MNVLHYSFSLSACPKCHLLVCKHTSLANLDFNPIPAPSLTDCSNTTLSPPDYPNAPSTPRGINFYILPSTGSENGQSWTTSGRESVDSQNAGDRFSSDNETVCDDVPFAQEHVIHSSLLVAPAFNQIVRTQSERCAKHFKPSISMTRSFSFSTIYNRSSTSSSSSWPPVKPIDSSISKLPASSTRSFITLLVLIISFLITNTIDIVLLYIYYHSHRWNFLLFLGVLLVCDLILWLNHLIEWKQIPSRFLFFPLTIRFYLLYELIDAMTFLFEKKFLHTAHPALSDSSSSSSTTTTTLETQISQTTDCPMITRRPSATLQKRTRQRLYFYLALFYLVHTGLITLINLYMWSNHFQLTTQSSLTMDSFLPRWQHNDQRWFATSAISTESSPSSAQYWPRSEADRQLLARRTLSTNWTSLFFAPSIPFSSTSSFVLTSLLYHSIVNYSLLSTFLAFDRSPLLILLSVLSRLSLILTRLYACVFLFRLNTWWLPMTFLMVHLTLILTLLCDRSKLASRRFTIFIQMVFSFVTHSSIDDRSINVLISLENISIFLHRLYLETYIDGYHQRTVRLITFLSVLIGLQVIGLLLDILTKALLERLAKRKTKH